MPAEAQGDDLRRARIKAVPRHILSRSLAPHKPPPHSQWHLWHLPRSPARPVGHVTVLTTPPRCGCKASGCINGAASAEEEPEADQNRRWGLLGLTGCLLSQGFCCGPAAALQHPWSATSTLEVRFCALKSQKYARSYRVLIFYEWGDHFYVYLIDSFTIIAGVCLLLQLSACLRGDTSRWAIPGWTMIVCSAPVFTRSVLAAVRREYMNSLWGLVSRCSRLETTKL